MSRPAFLTSPGAWLHTRRHAQTPADYACAVQQVQRRAASGLWIVACVLGCIAIGWIAAQGV